MNLINRENAVLVIIDVQEKLVNMLTDETVSRDAVKIAKAARILNIDTVVTEQYPKGLGATIEDIKNVLTDAFYIEKTFFSAMKEEKFSECLRKLNKKQVILFGIETHICVLQTAFDLVNSGYEVFVVKDACGSRDFENKNSALQRLRHIGVQTLTVEMVLFELLESSKNPKFKEVQMLIK